MITVQHITFQHLYVQAKHNKHITHSLLCADAPYLAGSGQLIPRAGHGGEDGCGGGANIGAQREGVGALQTYYSNTWESRAGS